MDEQKKAAPPRRLRKDERDIQIETRGRSHALDFMVAATQILTVMCLVKGNPAWRGGLALLFVGAAAMLFYKYDQYEEPLYWKVGLAFGLVAVGFFVWFGLAG